MIRETLFWRLAKFVLVMGAAVCLVYGVLPRLNASVQILGRMAECVEDNRINPASYYYTDVEQVAEAEAYLRNALGSP